MSARWEGTEVLPCRPGTAGNARRRRSEGTPSGRCPPPAAGGSDDPRREGTVELPRGPCSPSAAGMLGLALRGKKTPHKPA